MPKCANHTAIEGDYHRAEIRDFFFRQAKIVTYDTRTGHNWDVQLVKYIRELGVAALIRDMEEVGKKASSLVYFMYSQHGTPRWEKMVLDRVSLKLKAQKADDDSAYAAMAKHFEMPMQTVDPSWVIEARQRYKELNDRRAYVFEKGAKEEIRREMTRIENNLVRRGYQL